MLRLWITDQSRAELRVVGHAQFVRCLKQQTHPTAPLILPQVAIEVALNHVRMSSMLLRVCRRAAQDFPQKSRNVPRMVGTHVREDGRATRFSPTFCQGDLMRVPKTVPS
jgi:hypothetical protein